MCIVCHQLDKVLEGEYRVKHCVWHWFFQTITLNCLSPEWQSLYIHKINNIFWRKQFYNASASDKRVRMNVKKKYIIMFLDTLSTKLSSPNYPSPIILQCSKNVPNYKIDKSTIEFQFCQSHPSLHMKWRLLVLYLNLWQPAETFRCRLLVCSRRQRVTVYHCWQWADVTQQQLLGDWCFILGTGITFGETFYKLKIPIYLALGSDGCHDNVSQLCNRILAKAIIAYVNRSP